MLHNSVYLSLCGTVSVSMNGSHSNHVHVCCTNLSICPSVIQYQQVNFCPILMKFCIGTFRLQKNLWSICEFRTNQPNEQAYLSIHPKFPY